MKTQQELQTGGFTLSGATRYLATATDYCDQLFDRSIALGESDKAASSPREVTHDHVRSAATALSMKSNDRAGAWSIIGQVGEYLCAALAGVGGGKLEQSWGILLFGISLAFGVILFVTRNLRSNGK